MEGLIRGKWKKAGSGAGVKFEGADQVTIGAAGQLQISFPDTGLVFDRVIAAGYWLELEIEQVAS